MLYNSGSQPGCHLQYPGVPQANILLKIVVYLIYY